MIPPALAQALIALTSLAQAAGVPDDGKDAAGRLAFMRRSLEGYRFARDGERGSAFRLQAEPAFRLGKQYTDILEGAIFFWVGADGRPEAAVQVFKVQNAGAPKGLWIHEFSSLSPRPFVADFDGRPAWSPGTPGVEFRPVPGAEAPAASLAQRTRQLRAMAQEFKAADDFGKKGWHDLRLLPTPIARYGKPASEPIDGAAFAFVEGTDPEVLLFLEARPGKDKGAPEWQYALAPMTVFAVKATLGGRVAWELPDRMPAGDPSRPFFDRKYEPGATGVPDR